ncbi:MAG: acetyltransferase [Siculibacillus sp.]|nr:acetyltransferase [Siculibacillus sp.]
MIGHPAQSAFSLAIIGAGGHARVVMEAALRAGYPILGLIDRDPALHGITIGGHPVLGGDEEIERLGPEAVLLANGIGVRPTRSDPGTGLRARIHAQFVAAGHRFPPIIDPTATIAREVLFADGAQVMAAAVIQPRSSLGVGAVVNTRVSVDHDCAIGDHAFVSPGVVLCGGVTIGPRAFVGAGAIVLPGAEIGEAAVVQAGAVLGGVVPAGGFFGR